MYQRRSKSHWVAFEPELVLAEVYFGTNERELDRRDRKVVQEVAMIAYSEILRDKPVELTLLAQCDHRGSTAYNQWLSDQRLKVVADQLARSTLFLSKLDWVWAVSAGEELNLFESNDRKVLARNRRVVICWGKFDLSFVRSLRPKAKVADPARYDLKTGFASRVSPDLVRHEMILRGRPAF